MSSTILITGANRGLGLEFTRQYAEAGWQVHACCRDPGSADALQKLTSLHGANIQVHTLDVADFSQIDRLAAQLANVSIDVLLNNAGIYPGGSAESFGSIDYDAWAAAFRVNSMAAIKMAEAFLPQISRGQQKKIVSITSKMGSIEDNTSGGQYLYRSSKTALNMAVHSLASDLAPRGVTAIVLHPGWVQTDMGGPNGLIDASQSVSGMRHVIAQLTLADSGNFYAYDGKTIPW